jgi:hypothetical protein
MYASFNYFEIEMTKKQAESVSHPGPCDDDVEILLQDRKIKRQLKKIPDDKLRMELKEAGIDPENLQTRHDLEMYIIWIAGGNIMDNIHDKGR